MRNIIRLIQKYSNLLLFLLLQVISFFLLFSWRNSYHHTIYLSASNNVVGSLYKTNNDILEYFKLQEINDELKAENSRLKQSLYNFVDSAEIHLAYQGLLDEQQFIVRSVNVISSQFKQRENYLVIDKGEKDSVVSNMGIVGTKGVIGIVLNSSTNYASILPIINSNFQLAIRHRRSKSFGILLWEEKNNWKTAVVEDVPEYVKVHTGDIFETSGATGIFPTGILIGKVIKTEEIPASQFQRVYINLYEDFSSLSTAYVVDNKYQHEMLIIKDKSND